ncbi:hypothetical protein KGO95_00760 [Patescibacteria group bacterium]|nr:hypothetical protein [Patescibacteria group bacterium]
MTRALAQRKGPVALACLLLAGSLWWLVRTIRYEAALSDLYITKSACAYSDQKTVTVFLDQRATKELHTLGIAPTDLVIEANRVFAENKLPFRYDISRLRLESWDSSRSECKFFNAGFTNEQGCFVDELRPRYVRERKISDPDVLVFITATGAQDLSGKAYFNTTQGNGTIVMNIGMAPNRFLDRPRTNAVARRFFTRRFAQLLLHEQGHLYGLPHSPMPYSIMKANLDYLGGPKVQFDERSRTLLIQENKIWQRAREACTAAQE